MKLIILDIDSLSDDDMIASEMLNFSITLSFEEWKTISPQSKSYHQKYRIRTYEVLSPNHWSNVVQEHFFLHTKLPCAITYKKASVRPSGNVYLSIYGKCTECDSKLYGELTDIPTVKNR